MKNNSLDEAIMVYEMAHNIEMNEEQKALFKFAYEIGYSHGIENVIEDFESKGMG